MRTRTRNPPYPPNGASGVGIPKDTFTDEPKGRGWKPASRTSVNILSSAKLVVTCEVSHNGGATWNTVKLERPPFYWDGSYGLTGVTFLPTESATTQPYQPLDLVQMAMDRSRSDLFLLDFLREATETVKMIYKPWRFLQFVKKNHGVMWTNDMGKPLGRLKRTLDRAGSTWLEGTYGYIPFMHDLYAISQICSNPLGVLESCAMQPCITDHRQGFMQTLSPLDVDMSDSAFDARICVTKTQVYSGKRRVMIRWLYNPSFGAMSLARQMSTFLGLSDFGRVSLEAVRLSFVGDWFSTFASRCASNPAFNGPVMWLTHPLTKVSRSEKLVSFYGMPSLVRPATTPTMRNQKVHGGTATTEHRNFLRGTEATESIDNYSNNTDGLSAWRTTSGTFLALGELNTLVRRFQN